MCGIYRQFVRMEYGATKDWSLWRLTRVLKWTGNESTLPHGKNVGESVFQIPLTLTGDTHTLGNEQRLV